MANTAISVDGLGKRYEIVHEREPYGRLTESLWNAVRAPMDMVRGVRRGSTTEWIWALRDVSFELQQGDVVGVIGRNGAGKSTLLKVLSRITEPTTGTATLHGRVGTLLEVGTGFHPELTGRENIFMSGAVLGMRRKEIIRQFDAIVAFAGVEQFLDTPVKRYSSGMQVRLGFAVAAHLEPEILFVDEVLAVGDAGIPEAVPRSHRGDWLERPHRDLRFAQPAGDPQAVLPRDPARPAAESSSKDPRTRSFGHTSRPTSAARERGGGSPRKLPLGMTLRASKASEC